MTPEGLITPGAPHLDMISAICPTEQKSKYVRPNKSRARLKCVVDFFYDFARLVARLKCALNFRAFSAHFGPKTLIFRVFRRFEHLFLRDFWCAT